MLKRRLDAGVAIVILILYLPLVALIAVVIKTRGGPGPILCRQERINASGRKFLMWRFRCLAYDGPAIPETGTDLTKQPHLSPAGFWLRRYKLDRLPALLNVVTGDIGLSELGKL